MTNQMRKPEVREQLPDISLLPQIPHKREMLDMALFGPNIYSKNIKSMKGPYFHSKELPNITFTPARTSESISAVAQGFGKNGEYDAKRDVFDLRWLQAGWILKTDEGIYTNPLDNQGNPITDESRLKPLLKTDRKVNGIYLLDNGMAFAPYDSFERSIQDCDTFAQGGLARALEYTDDKEARKLRIIASPKHYKRGVHVFGFDEVTQSSLRVVELDSGGGLNWGRLCVGGYDWGGDDIGCAFGVLNESAEGASQKNK